MNRFRDEVGLETYMCSGCTVEFLVLQEESVSLVALKTRG